MSDNAAELEKTLQVQMDRINDAITRIKQNELTDISFMDQEVASLCQRILQADEKTAKQLEPKMITLINLLDDFAAEINAYQNRTAPDGNA